MKVVSTKKLIYSADRLGTKQEHIQIDLIIHERNDVTKMVTLKAVDSVVFDYGTAQEATTPIHEKYYVKSYDEFNQQREVLLSLYGEETILTGLELDDFLLQKALLYNLYGDPIWGSEGGDWIAKVDYVAPEEPPI